MRIILPSERHTPESALDCEGDFLETERIETVNPTQMGGIVRDVIKAVGLFFVFNGYVDGGMLEMIAGMGAALGASAWSWYTNKTSTMVAAIAESDRVAKVVTTPEIANKVPSPKVVAK